MRYKNTYITLEASLFTDLEQTIAKFNLHYAGNDDNRIMMDKAVFLIDYIRYQRSIRKEEITPGGYIRIPSKVLNIHLQKELRKYKDFLVQHDYIKTIPYNKDKSKSYGYLVTFFDNKKREDSSLEEYSVYKFLSIKYERYLSKSLEQSGRTEHKKTIADRKTKHLTKWLNGDNISIEWTNALKFIDGSNDLSIDQKISYSYSVNRIRFGYWYYLRSKNDNRLHSNLTNLPTVLRRFVSHQKQSLVSLDIKSSQPYLLAGVLNLLIRNGSQSALGYLMVGLRSKDVRDRFAIVMNSKTLGPQAISDFEAYKILVCENDIYNYIASQLSPSFIATIKTDSGYVDKIYNPVTGHKEKRHFEGLRDFCKVLVLEYMYCSIGSNERRLNELRRIYPNAVNSFITEFKKPDESNAITSKKRKKRTKKQQESINRSKKLFSKFLQQLEAFIMLDVITKELSKLNPTMFIATIHDSIIVPKGHENDVRIFMCKRFKELLGLEPEVKIEFW